jgi:predicted AAA+ superfamily ATPase
MFQLMKNFDPSLRFYLNFEDYRLTGINSKEFFRLIEIYYSFFPESKKQKVYFFFDEIQNVNKWENVVRHLLDNENCQIFITGSS